MRVMSPARREQARLKQGQTVELLRGDFIELLYDLQGRFAFKVRRCALTAHQPRTQPFAL